MRRFFVTTLLLAFGLSVSGFAQMPNISRQPQIEVFAGFAVPLSPKDFSDYYKVGISLHGQYVMFPSPKLGISFAAAYEGFSFDGDKFLQDLQASDPLTDYSGVGVDGSASVIELGVGLRPYLTSPEANTQMFLYGMLTYNILKTKADLSYNGRNFYSGEDTEKKFGVALGPGVEIPINDTMNLIGQGVFRYIFTNDEGTSFLGITTGLVF